MVAELSTCLVTMKDEGSIARSGMCMLPGKVLPRVCISRAAVNGSVCEDSQTDNV